MKGGEFVVLHSHSSIVHYPPHVPSSSTTGSLDYDDSHAHPRAVMRGFADVDKVEPGKADLWTLGLPEAVMKG